MHTDNDKKDILVLVEGITQELDDTTATAGAKYQFLSLHYKGAPVFYLLMLQKPMLSIQCKNSDIKNIHYT